MRRHKVIYPDNVIVFSLLLLTHDASRITQEA